jgi:hypothetical protein
MTYPVFIVCRDRLTGLTELLDWLERAGHADEVYLIDNDSEWEPLLDFYATTRHTVIRTGSNTGHLAGWTLGLIHKHVRGRRFIVTDPDIVPIEDCPLDAVERMAAVLDKSSQAVKCGFGIKVDDIAEWCREGIQAWEAPFWRLYDSRIGAYKAPIDTTFALHSPKSAARHRYKPAWRLPAPYLVRHLPWYSDPLNLTAEDAHYIARADKSVSNWSRYVMENV